MLEGKSVIVTGAGRGLGRAYAMHAAAHGARVIVNDIDAEAAEDAVAEIRHRGGTATPAIGSITDWDYCRRLVESCVATYGRLDGLVNNAGLFYVAEPWEDDEARIRRVVEVNVLGTMFCGVHALRQMKDQGSGSVVNVSSRALAGIARLSTYGGTKGAVTSWAYAAAIDAMPFGVRVNAISPVATTRMAMAMSGEVSDEVELDPEVAGRRPGAPMPDNVAPLVTFLLSDRSADITGQVVRLNGKQLSVLEHPIELEPQAQQDGAWTPEAVADAFDAELRALLRPVGTFARQYERPANG
jgi:NAD(P)-dependent dehydrogenase (short-subunit alcohol dehydrogenase family)